MKLVLLGSPGAGKGTQAQLLMKHYGLPLISVGDMLRRLDFNVHPLGKKIQQVMKEGGLVEDEVIIELLRERLKLADCKEGYILDGFPRTVSQAKISQEMGIVVDHVVEIKVADQLILERLTGRLVHPASGRVYHVKYNPPQIQGKDDVTGELLIQRADDQEETVKNRLKVYHEKTEPLIEFYNQMEGIKYIPIDGEGGVEEVALRIRKELEGGDCN